MSVLLRVAAAFLALWLLGPGGALAAGQKGKLRLATTTSTADSGLLEAILPAFEAARGVKVDVVAVGTGQALALGRAGDADVLLVHAREREEAFLAAGHGTRRVDIMYNDFVIVGPKDDPAGIRGMGEAAAALRRVAEAGLPFASRGDDSGTHSKERSLWSRAGLAPTAADRWFRSLGQGMGATLHYADETDAYTITDRGTFLAQRGSLPHLGVLVGGASIAANPDRALFNPYGLLLVSQEKSGVAATEAAAFAAWLASEPTQRQIAVFGRATHGQPLFYPNSPAWQRAVARAAAAGGSGG